MSDLSQACRNCHAPLQGEFCAACGQREGRPDLHFSEALGDIFGDIVTWDSRLWRTLVPLLARPGFLSAEYFVGRRARYMPPFRLYIVISFLMFFILSLNAVDAIRIERPGASGQESAAGKESAAGQTNVTGPDEPFSINLGDNVPPWIASQVERIERNALTVSDDPVDYLRDLLAYLPQVMFVMLPLFALLLRLAYLFSPFHFLQHLIFTLHFHSFAYVLYIGLTALEYITGHIDGLFALVLLVYLPLALRRAYRSSWPGALGKALSLFLIYGLALILGMAGAALAVLAMM